MKHHHPAASASRPSPAAGALLGLFTAWVAVETLAGTPSTPWGMAVETLAVMAWLGLVIGLWGAMRGPARGVANGVMVSMPLLVAVVTFFLGVRPFGEDLGVVGIPYAFTVGVTAVAVAALTAGLWSAIMLRRQSRSVAAALKS